MKEKEFYIYLGTQSLDRIRLIFETEKGEITDLIIQYEAIIHEKWEAIVRYDCAHGFFHRDLMYPNGEKIKKLIDMPNLKSALSYARQDIEDRWEWYKERYIKKLKK